MGLAQAAMRSMVDSVAFRASAAPYLLLDVDLRIWAANQAYLQATLRAASDITGELMFDAFPDNPATPQARGAERLARSFERALSAGQRDRMRLQRYDVRGDTGEFVKKTWLPVNTPVRDPDGRIVGVLHHVEDVTRLLVTTALEGELASASDMVKRATVIDRRGLMAAVQRDSVDRRDRADLLVSCSRQAIERVSRRIEAIDGPRSGRPVP